MVDISKLRADMEAALPPLIARSEVSRYSGGLYSAKTLEIYDSKGIGIPEMSASAWIAKLPTLKMVLSTG